MSAHGRSATHRCRRGAVVMLLVLATACGDEGGSDAARSTATTVVATRPRGAADCPAAMPAVRDVAYASVPGADPRQLQLDVYPASHGCPAPVVVWVHGGGWQFGDKHNQMNDKVPLWNGRRVHAW